MGIVILVSKFLGKLALKVCFVGGILYVEYRVAGGPPIGKILKAIKDKKLKEEVKKAAKEGKVIYLQPEQVV